MQISQIELQSPRKREHSYCIGKKEAGSSASAHTWGGGGRWNSFLCYKYKLPVVSLWLWHTPPDLRLPVVGSQVTGITFIMQSRSTSLCFMAGRFLAAWGTNVLFLAYNPSSRAGQNNIKKHLFSHNHGVTVPMYPLVEHNTCFKNATCYSYLHVIILLTNILIWSAFI